MIGIIGAMGIEVNALAELLEQKQTETVSGITFMRGTIYEKEVVLAVCGVGKVFAALCAEIMILKYNPDVLINTGVAGTLTNKLSIGNVAVSSAVVQHDMDTSPAGDPVGLLSGIQKIELMADTATKDALCSCLKELQIPHLAGTIATGDQFIASVEKKQWIANTFSAIASEMEGGAIGQVCYVNNKPFCVLRAISDCADGSSEENYAEFLEPAAGNAVEVMKLYLKNYA